MNTYTPDPVVRLLTVLATVVYRVACVFGILIVVAVLALESVAGPEIRRDVAIGVTATLELDAMPVGRAWGDAVEMALDDATALLRVPVTSAPVGFRSFTYLGMAVIYVLVLRFLFHLRQLFRRVRAGVPFDARNATDLRWLGVLLILIDTLVSAYSFGLSALVVRAMSTTSVPVAASFSMNGSVIVAGLVLLALAEIFQRGAVLEDEHAHVI